MHSEHKGSLPTAISLQPGFPADESAKCEFTFPPGESSTTKRILFFVVLNL